MDLSLSDHGLHDFYDNQMLYNIESNFNTLFTIFA